MLWRELAENPGESEAVKGGFGDGADSILIGRRGRCFFLGHLRIIGFATARLFV